MQKVEKSQILSEWIDYDKMVHHGIDDKGHELVVPLEEGPDGFALAGGKQTEITNLMLHTLLEGKKRKAKKRKALKRPSAADDDSVTMKKPAAGDSMKEPAADDPMEKPAADQAMEKPAVEIEAEHKASVFFW